MTAANTQIVTAFEDLGMTPEEIAAQEDLDVAVIKSTLAQFSSLYRKACKKDDSLNFTDDELARANGVISNLMQYAEDEKVQLRAAIYLRDDKKGRLDAVREMAGLNFNVLSMQSAMEKAMRAMNRAKGIIDVEEVKELAEVNS